MRRSVPTPARPSNDASAEPVAPQPTIATRPAASCSWPSAPIPRNRVCREYRSSNFSFSTLRLFSPRLFFRQPQGGHHLRPRKTIIISGGLFSPPDNTGFQRFIEFRQQAQGYYLLRRHAPFFVLMMLSLGPAAAAGSPASASPQTSQEPQTAQSSSALDAMSAYAGRSVRSIDLPGVQDKDHLLQLLAQKSRQPRH